MAAQRFKAVKLLGRGGFGEVYLAEDAVLGRPVALKSLSKEAREVDEAYQRFCREARVQARIDHPHVVRVYDCNLDGENPWIAMELVDGRDLDELVKREGPLGPAALERLARELAVALDAIHGEGILHRDLKPANVMIRNDSGAAVVMDLGLASVRDVTVLTRTGQIMGTPAFLPPETLKGEEWTREGDFYQVGAILFEAATGRRIIPGRDLSEVVANIAQGRMAEFPAHLGVPELLRRVIYKAAAFDPGQRFRSGAELVEALDTGEVASVRPAAAGPAAAAASRSGGFSFLDALDDTGAGGAVKRVVDLRGSGVARRAVVAVLVVAGLVAGLTLGGAGAPEDVRWAVVGDAVLVEFRGGGEVTLEVAGRGVPAGGPDAAGVRRAVARGIEPGEEVAARLRWGGTEGPRIPLTGERPAVLPEVVVAGPSAVELQVLRECAAWWRGWAADRVALAPGKHRMALPVGEDSPVLEWEERGVRFSQSVDLLAAQALAVAGLRRELEVVDPVAVYRARAMDRSGRVPTEGFASSRAHWDPLLPWVPAILDGDLPAARRSSLFAFLQRWQWTVAAERLLGDGDVADLALPAGRSGSRFAGVAPWKEAVTRELAMEPLDGADPWRRRPVGDLLMVLPRSMAGKWTTGKWVECASEVDVTWPEDAPTRGPVCLTLPAERLPATHAVRLAPKDGEPGMELRFWHPAAAPRAEYLEGPVSVVFPADLGPRPGQVLRLEVTGLITESLNFLRIQRFVLAWPGGA